MNEYNIKGCKGCAAVVGQQSNGPTSCFLVRHGRMEECPCQDCLVKVTCKEGCRPLTNLITTVQEVHGT